MNRLLIGVLDILNKLLALLIIVSGTVSGYFGPYGYTESGAVAVGPHGIVGALLGFVGGVIVAGLVSGVLAAIITNSHDLSAIRTLLAADADQRPV